MIRESCSTCDTEEVQPGDFPLVRALVLTKTGEHIAADITVCYPCLARLDATDADILIERGMAYFDSTRDLTPSDGPVYHAHTTDKAN